jgi:predicted nucleic acid-binding Zn ribbon protein
MWKIELRDNCKICGKPLPNARFRTFCSTECRTKSNNQKQIKSGYSVNWQREKRVKVKHNLSPCGDSHQGV